MLKNLWTKEATAAYKKDLAERPEAQAYSDNIWIQEDSPALLLEIAMWPKKLFEKSNNIINVNNFIHTCDFVRY